MGTTATNGGGKGHAANTLVDNHLHQLQFIAQDDHVVGVQVAPRTPIFRIYAQFPVFVFKCH